MASSTSAPAPRRGVPPRRRRTTVSSTTDEGAMHRTQDASVAHFERVRRTDAALESAVAEAMVEREVVVAVVTGAHAPTVLDDEGSAARDASVTNHADDRHRMKGAGSDEAAR